MFFVCLITFRFLLMCPEVKWQNSLQLMLCSMISSKIRKNPISYGALAFALMELENPQLVLCSRKRAIVGN